MDLGTSEHKLKSAKRRSPLSVHQSGELPDLGTSQNCYVALLPPLVGGPPPPGRGGRLWTWARPSSSSSLPSGVRHYPSIRVVICRT